jgi:hypothetical protein
MHSRSVTSVTANSRRAAAMRRLRRRSLDGLHLHPIPSERATRTLVAPQDTPPMPHHDEVMIMPSTR